MLLCPHGSGLRACLPFPIARRGGRVRCTASLPLDRALSGRWDGEPTVFVPCHAAEDRPRAPATSLPRQRRHAIGYRPAGVRLARASGASETGLPAGLEGCSRASKPSATERASGQACADGRPAGAAMRGSGIRTGRPPHGGQAAAWPPACGGPAGGRHSRGPRHPLPGCPRLPPAHTFCATASCRAPLGSLLRWRAQRPPCSRALPRQSASGPGRDRMSMSRWERPGTHRPERIAAEDGASALAAARGLPWLINVALEAPERAHPLACRQVTARPAVVA
jgi:hypothetical protein